MEEGWRVDQEWRKKAEVQLLHKVGEVVSAVGAAKHADQVICALHSLAVMVFPVDAALFSGALDGEYRKQVTEARGPTKTEMDAWFHVFYRGASFPTLARLLLYDVASNWLPCFPLSGRTHLYDLFFTIGPAVETIQVLVPTLSNNRPDEGFDRDLVCANAERMIVLCLLINKGVQSIIQEFSDSYKLVYDEAEKPKPDCLAFISSLAQLIASIPDKARPNSPAALLSHSFFNQIAAQLLAGARERSMKSFPVTSLSKNDGSFLFIGDMFARICRRGATDILVAEMIVQIRSSVKNFLSQDCDSSICETIVSRPENHFWHRIIKVIKDSYVVERLSEGILHKLAAENVTDVEAYWSIWLLYSPNVNEVPLRSIFVDKFILWKVFPICCLRWILQSFILECPPQHSPANDEKRMHLLDIVQRLAGIWSKQKFVQSASIEQQAYITAAFGLSIDKLSKDELETTKDVLHSILQGVSCRLESPNHLVRRMASSIALVFSRIIDPAKPLYLDDDCKEGAVDWEFGMAVLQPQRRIHHIDKPAKLSSLSENDSRLSNNTRNVCGKKKENEESSNFMLIDPDEIVDPAVLDNISMTEDEEDDFEGKSDASSDSSLVPYDLSDDDADLKKKFSQLTDIISALRKSDDPDGVENALDVAEKLIRASPDELGHVSAELARALVRIRCSDLTIEGEEESAEEKRQKALIALLVSCPFESAASLSKLLYSPHVDVSQRILILDVMTDAALELSEAKDTRIQNKRGSLISYTQGNQPWFLPSAEGPIGAGPWKEISETGTVLSYTHRFERDLPARRGEIKKGKSRRWRIGQDRVQDDKLELSKNEFPLFGAAFMLPVMQDFDKKSHGVDFLGRDFIVLGKLIYMLGVCMKCMTMHPEASALAPALLDMLRSREIYNHAEAYVRKSALFAASCILVALHPSFVASALAESNQDIAGGLDWIRTWALHAVESDIDNEVSTMAMTCIQLHAEMALQATRSFESAQQIKAAQTSSKVVRDSIIIPYPKIL